MKAVRLVTLPKTCADFTIYVAIFGKLYVSFYLSLSCYLCRMDDLTKTLPDPTKSKDEQLRTAVETIKNQSNSIQSLKVKIKVSF